MTKHQDSSPSPEPASGGRPDEQPEDLVPRRFGIRTLLLLCLILASALGAMGAWGIPAAFVLALSVVLVRMRHWPALLCLWAGVLLFGWALLRMPSEPREPGPPLWTRLFALAVMCLGLLGLGLTKDIQAKGGEGDRQPSGRC